MASKSENDIDRAFIRRFRFIPAFPLPAATARERIWDEVCASKARRAVLILVTGVALYLLVRWLIRCCAADETGTVHGDEADAARQELPGANRDRGDLPPTLME